MELSDTRCFGGGWVATCGSLAGFESADLLLCWSMPVGVWIMVGGSMAAFWVPWPGRVEAVLEALLSEATRLAMCGNDVMLSGRGAAVEAQGVHNSSKATRRSWGSLL
jgi:hypothetical protein